MNMDNDFNEIMKYAHFWNWAPDWAVAQEVYTKVPSSFSVLTPFAYAYLEEMIRSTTSEYGMEFVDEHGNPKKRKVGIALINLAIEENCANIEYVNLLNKMKTYFDISKPQNGGSNRNNVAHGYMHARYWDKEDFEQLIHDIATLSKYSRF